jgi:hypothetical protein
MHFLVFFNKENDLLVLSALLRHLTFIILYQNVSIAHDHF